MMKQMLVVAVLVASGCARSQVLERHVEPLAHAPVNDPGRGGRVVYEIGGKDGVAGRAEAYKQMSETCGGRYRIEKEYDGAPAYKLTGIGYTFGTPMLSGSVLLGGASPLTPRVIEFQCEAGQEN